MRYITRHCIWEPRSYSKLTVVLTMAPSVPTVVYSTLTVKFAAPKNTFARLSVPLSPSSLAKQVWRSSAQGRDR